MNHLLEAIKIATKNKKDTPKKIVNDTNWKVGQVVRVKSMFTTCENAMPCFTGEIISITEQLSVVQYNIKLDVGCNKCKQGPCDIYEAYEYEIESNVVIDPDEHVNFYC